MSEPSAKPFPAGRLIDGKPRAILFDAVKCIGCRQCVQACKDWNDHPRTSLYELSSTTWITMEPPVLEGLSERWARNSCMHCEFPMCAAVCPVEAITKYEEGPVVIDPKLCIGCEYCIYACPWGALSEEDIQGVISKDGASGKAAKCTMCSERVTQNQSPFCVQACPVEALDFGFKEDITAKAAERAQGIGGHVYGNKEAGGTQVVYVLKDTIEDYGVRNIDPVRYPNHRIPLGLMLKDLFTLRCGFPGKLRALCLAIIHPRRLLYRYSPFRNLGR